MSNNIDLAELASIVRLLKELNFTEFNYSKGDVSLAVRRGDFSEESTVAATASSQPVSTPSPAPKEPAPSLAVSTPSKNSQAKVATAPANAALASDEFLIRAPLLGVFYPAPKPGEPNFIKVGDQVDENSTVCIIEVMKLMNTVSAGVNGTVTHIHVAEGDFVEFDQPLFTVKRSAQ